MFSRFKSAPAAAPEVSNPLRDIVAYLRQKQKDSNYQERLTHFGHVLQFLADADAAGGDAPPDVFSMSFDLGEDSGTSTVGATTKKLTGTDLATHIASKKVKMTTSSWGTKERYNTLFQKVVTEFETVLAAFPAFVAELNQVADGNDPVIQALRPSTISIAEKIRRAAEERRLAVQQQASATTTATSSAPQSSAMTTVKLSFANLPKSASGNPLIAIFDYLVTKRPDANYLDRVQHFSRIIHRLVLNKDDAAWSATDLKTILEQDSDIPVTKGLIRRSKARYATDLVPAVVAQFDDRAQHLEGFYVHLAKSKVGSAQADVITAITQYLSRSSMSTTYQVVYTTVEAYRQGRRVLGGSAPAPSSAPSMGTSDVALDVSATSTTQTPAATTTPGAPPPVGGGGVTLGGTVPLPPSSAVDGETSSQRQSLYASVSELQAAFPDPAVSTGGQPNDLVANLNQWSSMPLATATLDVGVPLPPSFDDGDGTSLPPLFAAGSETDPRRTSLYPSRADLGEMPTVLSSTQLFASIPFGAIPIWPASSLVSATTLSNPLPLPPLDLTSNFFSGTPTGLMGLPLPDFYPSSSATIQTGSGGGSSAQFADLQALAAGVSVPFDFAALPSGEFMVGRETLRNVRHITDLAVQLPQPEAAVVAEQLSQLEAVVNAPWSYSPTLTFETTTTAAPEPAPTEITIEEALLILARAKALLRLPEGAYGRAAELTALVEQYETELYAATYQFLETEFAALNQTRPSIRLSTSAPGSPKAEMDVGVEAAPLTNAWATESMALSPAEVATMTREMAEQQQKATLLGPTRLPDIEVESADTVAALYIDNHRRAEVFHGEDLQSSSQMYASSLLTPEVMRWKQRSEQMNANYLKLRIQSRHIAAITQITSKLEGIAGECNKLYYTLNEIINTDRVMSTKVFSRDDERLFTDLLVVYLGKKYPNKGKEYDQDIAAVMQVAGYLERLRQFFNFTPQELLRVCYGQADIASLLSAKIRAHQMIGIILGAMERVTVHQTRIHELLEEMKERLTDAEHETLDVIQIFQERLIYFVRRSTQFMPTLVQVREQYREMQAQNALSQAEVQHIAELEIAFNLFTKAQLIREATQAAHDFSEDVEKLLTKADRALQKKQNASPAGRMGAQMLERMVSATGLFAPSPKLGARKASDWLTPIKAILEGARGRRNQDENSILDFGYVLEQLNSTLSHHKIDFVAMTFNSEPMTDEFEKFPEIKLLQRIFRYYQKKAQDYLQYAGAAKMQPLPASVSGISSSALDALTASDFTAVSVIFQANDRLQGTLSPTTPAWMIGTVFASPPPVSASLVSLSTPETTTLVRGIVSTYPVIGLDDVPASSSLPSPVTPVRGQQFSSDVDDADDSPLKQSIFQ